jgi:hypothetical protein
MQYEVVASDQSVTSVEKRSPGDQGDNGHGLEMGEAMSGWGKKRVMDKYL